MDLFVCGPLEPLRAVRPCRVWSFLSYHQHVLQQAQVAGGTFAAVAQRPHLDVFADLRVVSSLLKGDTHTHTEDVDVSA